MRCRGHAKQRGIGAIFVAVALLSATPARAAEAELSGRADLDVRIFADAPKHVGQAAGRIQPSLLLRPELFVKWNDGIDSLSAISVLRLDAVDSERTHGDIRELAWRHIGDGWTLTSGIDTVFWGATESRHLVDIVNQTDLVEDPGGEKKLGQPMLNLAYQFEQGEVAMFWLPIFRERSFPGRNGRHRGAVIVDTERAVYPDGKGADQFAVRYTRTMGLWDAGLSYFHGISREPRSVLGIDAGGRVVVIPYYDRIDQLGFDLQGAVGDWLWKLEAIGRSGHGNDIAAFVGGFEYTAYGVFDGDTDLGIIAEYLYDSRSIKAPATPFDDDVYVAVRLSLNDAQDTSLLGGALIDRNNGGVSVNFEFSTRLTDFLSLDIEAHTYRNISVQDPLSAYDRDHNILIRFSRYF